MSWNRFVLLLSLCVLSVTAILPPSVRISPPLSSNSKRASCVNNGLPITLNGGNVMPYAKIYVIWYGNWIGNTGTTIIPGFFASVGASNWYASQLGYYGADGLYVMPNISYVSSINDNYSMGKNLNYSSVDAIVSNAIVSSLLPYDSAGLYFVLGAADVLSSDGFCTSFCGWHSADFLQVSE